MQLHFSHRLKPVAKHESTDVERIGPTRFAAAVAFRLFGSNLQ